MSKYQEALTNVKRIYAESEHYDEEDIRLLQELVDKATPKKPIIKQYKNSEHYLYPNCKNHRFGIIDYGEYKIEWRKGSELMLYCPKCGQALDWSDEDEK